MKIEQLVVNMIQKPKSIILKIIAVNVENYLKQNLTPREKNMPFNREE